MDKNEYETLKLLIKDPNWCVNGDSVLSVGNVLREERIIDHVGTAFDYFEAPWHYEPEIKDLIKEYELELVSEKFFNLPICDREPALDWMFTFNIVSKDAYDLLLDDMDDTI